MPWRGRWPALIRARRSLNGGADGISTAR